MKLNFKTPLTDNNIKIICNRMKIPLVGVFMDDELPDKYKDGNYIVNLDTSLRGHSGSVTEHIVASPISFVKAISKASLASSESRETWFKYCHEQQRKDCAFPEMSVATNNGEQTNTDQTYASMTQVIKALTEQLPTDAVYSFGAGNHCLWAQRYLPTHTFPSQLSTRNGAMGYSLPAGIVAALESPERLSIVVTGDGEFMMNEAELSTSIRYDAPVLIVLMDNQQFGTIRQHQEAHYPDRVSGTQLQNPDFAALANAFGAHGIRVDNNKDIETSVTNALRIVTKERKTVLLHVITDPDELVP